MMEDEVYICNKCSHKAALQLWTMSLVISWEDEREWEVKWWSPGLVTTEQQKGRKKRGRDGMHEEEEAGGVIEV